ncbi:hypothetical protein JQ581_30045 [Bradyrhizobium liaoningense]|uniref:hypothetical protein n=1 Tax=Bradyrhizobium liaoningense TaxID=43992 RepID=UPI001BA91356|nr:hypothetical protein [Bradyrhizobium liaoningense]MBR0741182.1 hypothetical protein [Bradyrhizobium liaoningense]
MEQRYSLVAMCLLLFGAILAAAMATDPKGFSVRDWQPLMAAFVALGAASLAYQAAMAKLDHDRILATEERRRKTLAIGLRVRLALGRLKSEVDALVAGTAPHDETSAFQTKGVPVDFYIVSSQPAIEEAWDNIDLFPVDLAHQLYSIKIGYDNFDLFKRKHAGTKWSLKRGEALPDELAAAHEAFVKWSNNCTQCLTLLLPFVRGLRK